MLRKILGLSTLIVLASCLIEGSGDPSMASNLNQNKLDSQNNYSHNSYQIARARTYRVRLGDTLGGIAYRFGISVNQILNYNPHLRSRPHLIYVGETINLGGSSATPVAVSGSGRKYTVRPGDTLGGIAIRHGLSLRTIVSYNPHLASRIDRINVGETINVGSPQIIRQTSSNNSTTPTPTPPKPTQRRRQTTFNNLPQDRRQGSDNTGSKRGPDRACTEAGKNLRAIAPKNGLQSTFEDYPYFFWYFPGVEYTKNNETTDIEFSLLIRTNQDDEAPEYSRIKRQELKGLNFNQSGIIAFALPSTFEPLEEGQEYLWQIRIKCTRRTAMNLSYSIQRKSTDNPELISKLENAPVDRHPVIFAESGVWFDALRMIALQLQQAPEDPILTEDWNNVLKLSGSEDLIGEPIQYIEPNIK